MEETRICNVCGKEKRIKSFEKTKANYRLRTCSSCVYARRKKRPGYLKKRAEQAKKRRARNPESYKASARRYYHNNRDAIIQKDRQERMEVLQHYGGKCACCGEHRYEFLAIDHINGGGTKHRKETKNRPLHKTLKAEGYPSGYRVLCHNCNSAYGYYGYCPHHVHV
jgi:hypothetical protein